MPHEYPDDEYRSTDASRRQYQELELLNAGISRVNNTIPLDKEAQEDVAPLAESLVREVEDLLEESGDEVESREELLLLLGKLDTAFAITKNPVANDLRRMLEEKFGPL